MSRWPVDYEIRSRYRYVKLHGERRELIHRVRAERAIGRRLPLKAVVHHADETRSDDGPLVICEDQSYHLELHRKMRVLRAGGNPWTDRFCASCNTAKLALDFKPRKDRPSGRESTCRTCRNR